MTVAVAAGVALAAGATGAAYARTPAPNLPAGTRAALDPALVAGRGATVAFTEQEAESAPTTGTVIGPGRSAYTLPAEASGRAAVHLPPRPCFLLKKKNNPPENR
jgi:hypothetical protein